MPFAWRTPLRPGPPPQLCQQQHGTRSHAPASRVVVGRTELGEGSRVRVTAPIRVFHSLKYKQGLDIQGYLGTILSNVCKCKGKVVTANKPWKTALEANDPSGKPMKLIVHLVRILFTSYLPRMQATTACGALSR